MQSASVPPSCSATESPLKTGCRRADKRTVSETVATRATASWRKPNETSMIRSLSESRIVGLMLVAYAAYSLAIVSHPITEGHAFRQTQTAFIARGFIRHGIDLLHPVVPVYGPSSQIPYELPWYQAIAATLARLGHLSETVALRSTSTAFTLLTAYFVYRLTRRMGTKSAATIATALFLFCPFTLRWGRASLIESFTTAMTLAWVLSVVEFPGEKKPRSKRVLFTGAVAGAIAATSKITTFLPWGIFVIPTIVRQWRSRQWLQATTTASSGLVSLAAGLLWTKHADGIKAGDPFTSWLTSKNLQTFNIGTLAQRLSIGTWETIFGRSSLLIIGPVGIIGIGWALCSKGDAIRWDLTALLGVFLTALAVFTNLYAVHDYYQVAIVPALVIPVGLGLSRLSDTFAISPRLASATALASLIVLASPYVRKTVVGVVDNRPISASIKAATPPGAGAIVTGLGWSPEILYFADRWGVMADGHIVTAKDLRSKPYFSRLTTLAVVNGFDPVTLDIIRSIQWIAPLDPFAFRLGPMKEAPGFPPPSEGTVFFPSLQTTTSRLPKTILCDGAFHPVDSTAMTVHTSASGVTITSTTWQLPAIDGILTTDAERLRCFGPKNASVTVRELPNSWKP